MSLTKPKNKSIILKRIDFYRQDRYCLPNDLGLLRAVLRLEWENTVLKETLKQKKINIQEIFEAYKEQTFFKRLDRAIDEYFKPKPQYGDYDDSILSRINQKIKGEE
jgi:hypothetical protein